MFLSLWLVSGRGVVHPSFWSYGPSRQDWSLHLFLPEERGGPAALRRKQSGTCPFLNLVKVEEDKGTKRSDKFSCLRSNKNTAFSYICATCQMEIDKKEWENRKKFYAIRCFYIE